MYGCGQEAMLTDSHTEFHNVASCCNMRIELHTHGRAPGAGPKEKCFAIPGRKNVLTDLIIYLLVFVIQHISILV